MLQCLQIERIDIVGCEHESARLMVGCQHDECLMRMLAIELVSYLHAAVYGCHFGKGCSSVARMACPVYFSTYLVHDEESVTVIFRKESNLALKNLFRCHISLLLIDGIRDAVRARNRMQACVVLNK